MTPTPTPAEESPRKPDQPQDKPQDKPDGDPPAKLSEDPRARRALEKKNPGGRTPGSQGAGHSKAANSSSKQGKREKKVRW